MADAGGDDTAPPFLAPETAAVRHGRDFHMGGMKKLISVRYYASNILLPGGENRFMEVLSLREKDCY